MNIVDPHIESYAAAYSSQEDELMAKVAAYTRDEHPHHHMLSGHLQGKFLEMVSFMIRPMRILEIGTFTGYSALALAKGMQTGGQLHSIELREEDAAKAQSFFDQADFGGQIILHTGNALEVIPTLEETWDLVFIDADKVSYQQYFELVLPRLRQNGFILADNIFFHGEVLEEPIKGKNAKAMRDFSIFIRDKEGIDKMILTIRDGLYLIRKS